MTNLDDDHPHLAGSRSPRPSRGWASSCRTPTPGDRRRLASGGPRRGAYDRPTSGDGRDFSARTVSVGDGETCLELNGPDGSRVGRGSGSSGPRRPPTPHWRLPPRSPSVPTRRRCGRTDHDPVHAAGGWSRWGTATASGSSTTSAASTRRRCARGSRPSDATTPRRGSSRSSRRTGLTSRGGAGASPWRSAARTRSSSRPPRTRPTTARAASTSLGRRVHRAQSPGRQPRRGGEHRDGPGPAG